MAAATVASVVTVFDGPVRIRYATVTLSTSYGTGGDTITAAAFGLQSLDAVFLQSGGAGVVLNVSSTQLKILAYGTNTSTSTATAVTTLGLNQIASTTDVSTTAIKVLVVGH